MKKMLAGILSMSTLIAAIPASVSAEYVQKFYTYNELIQMSDEEFSELYDYSAYYFGNDEVPDEVKFEKYLNQVPDFYIGDNYESEYYYIFKQIVNGKYESYISLDVDRFTPLSELLTADMLGFPAEWEVIRYDGVKFIETGVQRQFHEYRVMVPVDVVADFESFIRLSKYNNLKALEKVDFGITNISNIFSHYLPMGEQISNLYGDANLDYKVNIADAVLVMQVATNPDKYAQGKSAFSISAQGEINADVDGKAGLTNEDALLIQKFKLGFIDNF